MRADRLLSLVMLLQARRVSQLSMVEVLDERFVRPADLNLASFWESWCAEFESTRATYLVRVRVAAHGVGEWVRSLGERMRESVARAAAPDSEGWITVELPFESLDEARARLLGLGRAIEVLEPEPLRLSIADYARQIVDLYEEERATGPKDLRGPWVLWRTLLAGQKGVSDLLPYVLDGASDRTVAG